MRLIDEDALFYDLEIAPLTGDGGVDTNDLDDIIKRQLTIEERKIGRWIDDGSELGCACSECCASLDEYISNLNECNYLIKYPKFCPNCGAKMGV